MTEEYKPKRREILRQMGRDAKRVFSYENVRDFLYYSAKYSLKETSIPFAIPTTRRRFNEWNGFGCRTIRNENTGEDKQEIEKFCNRDGRLSEAKLNGRVIGLVLGLVTGLVAVVGIPVYGLDKGYPEALAIPIATNIVSGVYEWYRHTRNKIAEGEK